MSNVMMLQPRYYKDFQCIGGKCERTCCAEWRIEIDKASYDRFMAQTDEEMHAAFLENIEVVREEPFRADFVLDRNGLCNFVDKNGLCRIQLKYGHSFLCDTCLSFPRTIYIVNNVIEASLNMSCEAAVKIALFNEEPMMFEEVTYKPAEQVVLNGEMYIDAFTSSSNAYDIFGKLQKASIFIMQSRRYRLWERLIILGLFIKQADALFADGKDDDVPELADKFIERAEGGLYDNLAKTIPGEYNIKVNFILTLLSLQEISSIQASRNAITRMAEGLGINGNAGLSPDTQDVADSYEAALNKYYLPFFDGGEYVLENLMVNTIFSAGFPFAFNTKSKTGLFNNYQKIVIKYCLIKFILVGSAGYYKDNFGSASVIKDIVNVSRLLEHSPAIVDKIKEFMASKGMDGLGALCILIKE